MLLSDEGPAFDRKFLGANGRVGRLRLWHRGCYG